MCIVPLVVRHQRWRVSPSATSLALASPSPSSRSWCAPTSAPPTTRSSWSTSSTVRGVARQRPLRGESGMCAGRRAADLARSLRQAPGQARPGTWQQLPSACPAPVHAGNFQFIEDLVARKKDVSPISCTRQCAGQWELVSTAASGRAGLRCGRWGPWAQPERRIEPAAPWRLCDGLPAWHAAPGVPAALPRTPTRPHVPPATQPHLSRSPRAATSSSAPTWSPTPCTARPPPASSTCATPT